MKVTFIFEALSIISTHIIKQLTGILPICRQYAYNTIGRSRKHAIFYNIGARKRAVTRSQILILYMPLSSAVITVFLT